MQDRCKVTRFDINSQQGDQVKFSWVSYLRGSSQHPNIPAVGRIMNGRGKEGLGRCTNWLTNFGWFMVCEFKFMLALLPPTFINLQCCSQHFQLLQSIFCFVGLYFPGSCPSIEMTGRQRCRIWAPGDGHSKRGGSWVFSVQWSTNCGLEDSYFRAGIMIRIILELFLCEMCNRIIYLFNLFDFYPILPPNRYP